MRRKGEQPAPSWLINGFRKAIHNAGLNDISLDGYPYTWFKSLGTERVVEERLDPALANEAWFHLFRSASMDNLVAPVSDHYPILLTRVPIVRPRRTRKNFRFENAWRMEPSLEDVVQARWQNPVEGDIITKLEEPSLEDVVQARWQNHVEGDIITKLEGCAEDLQHWTKTNCNKLKNDMEEC